MIGDLSKLCKAFKKKDLQALEYYEARSVGERVIEVRRACARTTPKIELS